LPWHFRRNLSQSPFVNGIAHSGVIAILRGPMTNRQRFYHSGMGDKTRCPEKQ
jgi:hypothetical protein